MKRMFYILLFICLLNNSIYAEEYNSTGTYSISLSCTNLPSYSVKIPKSIDVSKNNTELTFSVKGDIYADQTLNVVFDSSATLTSSSKQETIYVFQDKSSWTYDSLSDVYSDFIVTLNHDELSAGIWQGNLNVVISLQED